MPLRPRYVPRLLTAGLILAFGLLTRAPAHARAADPAVAPGLLVSLAATSETVDAPALGARPTALVLAVSLDNETGRDLSGLQIVAPVPANAHVANSWLGQPGQGAGAVQGGSVTWTGLALAPGGRLGPAAYRVVPDDGADGARIFVNAVVQPRVTWNAPTTGTVTLPFLPLNGLWGEDNVRRTVLPTGLTIFTQERPDTPTVALRVSVRAGSRDEDSTTCGASYWLEHGHFLGTPTLPDSQAIGRTILSVGGEFNASTGWESTQFWDLVPAGKFSVAVNTLADQMLHSTYPWAAFEREKQILYDEINLRGDNPSVHAFDQFIKLVFRTSPLRHSPADVECLPTMSTDTVFAYLAQHYVTGNMAIDASGNLRHDDAVAALATAFAGLPVGPRLARPAVPEPVETDMRVSETGDASAPATIRLGWPAPGDNSPDWPAMSVLSDILGSVGQRMAESVRTSHVVGTDIDADYVDFSDAGALMLTASAPAEQANTVIGLLLAEVQRLRDDDVADADIQDAVRATAGQKAVSSELNLPQTARASSAVADTLQSYDEQLARLQTVTPADVQRVAQEYLDPANYSLAVVHQ